MWNRSLKQNLIWNLRTYVTNSLHHKRCDYFVSMKIVAYLVRFLYFICAELQLLLQSCGGSLCMQDANWTSFRVWSITLLKKYVCRADWIGKTSQVARKSRITRRSTMMKAKFPESWNMFPFGSFLWVWLICSCISGVFVRSGDKQWTRRHICMRALRPSRSAPRPSGSAPRSSRSPPRPSRSAPRPSRSAPQPSRSAPRPSMCRNCYFICALTFGITKLINCHADARHERCHWNIQTLNNYWNCLVGSERFCAQLFTAVWCRSQFRSVFSTVYCVVTILNELPAIGCN